MQCAIANKLKKQCLTLEMQWTAGLQEGVQRGPSPWRVTIKGQGVTSVSQYERDSLVILITRLNLKSEHSWLYNNTDWSAVSGVNVAGCMVDVYVTIVSWYDGRWNINIY